MKKLFASLLLLTLAVTLSAPSFGQDTGGDKKDASHKTAGKTKAKATEHIGTPKTDAAPKDAGKAKAKGKTTDADAKGDAASSKSKGKAKGKMKDDKTAPPKA